MLTELTKIDFITQRIQPSHTIRNVCVHSCKNKHVAVLIGCMQHIIMCIFKSPVSTIHITYQTHGRLTRVAITWLILNDQISCSFTKLKLLITKLNAESLLRTEWLAVMLLQLFYYKRLLHFSSMLEIKTDSTEAAVSKNKGSAMSPSPRSQLLHQESV